MRLIINGYEMDMTAATKIRLTKQANDIVDIATRQSNFAPSFDLPKTKNNVKAMGFVSLVGNNSNVPYQKNETYLYGDSGEILIYKGWAIVKDTTDVYKVHTYDGIIDFYKAIENRTLTEIGLAELNHLKNLDTVMETWTDLEIPYRYNVADYNGKMIYDFDKLNIDYLIPSASVPYLWNKLFQFIGWTYEGSAFNLEDFKNMWLSYPKTIGDDTQETIPIHVWDFTAAPSYYGGPNGPFGSPVYYWSNFLTHSPLLNNSYAVSPPFPATYPPPDGVFITVINAGLYKFTFNGVLSVEGDASVSPVDIMVGKNTNGGTNTLEVGASGNTNENINAVFYKNMQAGEEFAIFPTPQGNIYGYGAFTRIRGDMQIDFELVTGNAVDFEEAFIGMSIKDFVNEVLVRFSLTPFPDLYNKNILFLTVDEIIQNDQIDDWSKKYRNRIVEEYITGSYARRNKFTMKYNVQDANHNDGYLYVNNVNLQDETTVFPSKIYSPERSKVSILGRNYNTYKFWDKQVKDDGNVEYKPLDNKFYFMKSEIVNMTLNVGSEIFEASETVFSFPVEDYSHMSMREIINRYYPTMYAILNKSKEHKALMDLNALDIQGIDFSKPVFIEQEASYFLKNKINGWQSGKLTTVELIKLSLEQNQSDIEVPVPMIMINPSAIEPNPPFSFNWIISTNYAFLNYSPISATIYATQLTGLPGYGGVPTGLVYSEAVNLANSTHNFSLPTPLDGAEGWYEMKIVDDNFDPDLVSNLGYVFIGGGEEDPEPVDSIYVTVSNDPEDVTTGSPILRNVTYRFNNFTPTTATFKCQANGFINGVPYGLQTVIELVNLTQDVTHNLPNVSFDQGIGFYKLEVITDVINYELNSFIG